MITNEEKELFELLKKDREENANVIEKSSMDGVRDSVTEKYSEEAHFIYELLQNADDVKAKNIEFILEENGLIFKHDGTEKFNITNPKTEKIDRNSRKLGHINSITSIGQSTKSTKKSKYNTENTDESEDSKIGKFGVGFKAVFQYTDEPYIYEDKFKFKIIRFIVPELLENNHSNRAEGETLFYFPFKNDENKSKETAYNEILAKISNLQYPLLFITNIQSIKWTNYKESGFYHKKILESKIENNIVIEKIILENKYKENVKLFDNNNKVNIFKLSKKLENGLIYSIAYRTDEKNNILSDLEIPTFCFFPTTELNKLKFLVHAPFLLIDNRQGIKRNSEWNNLLIKNIAELAAESLEICKKNGFVNDVFFMALPHKESDFENTFYYFYKPIYTEITKKLKTIEIFPTKEGDKYLLAKNGYTTGSLGLLELFSSSQLAQLMNNEEIAWILPEKVGLKRKSTDFGNYISTVIGIKELNAPEIVTKITAEFFEKQEENWWKKFYKFIIDIRATYPVLKTKPCLIAENGKAYSLLKDNVIQIFLPYKENEIKNKKNIDITTDENNEVIENNFINNEFITIKESLTNDEDSLKFFKDFDLKNPDTLAHIDHVVIPKYLDKTKFPNTLEHFILFYKYYYKECPPKEKNNFIEKIKKLSFLKVTDSLDNKNYRIAPDKVYFPTKELKLYFENFKEKIYWLRKEDYKNTNQKNEISEIDFEIFLKEIGVNFVPKQISFNSEDQYKYLKKTPVTELEYILDYKIEGLDNFFENITLKKSIEFCNFIANSNYENKAEVKYYYYNYKYLRPDAEFIKQLQTVKWLYDKNDNLVCSFEIKIEDLNEKYNINFFKNKEIDKLLRFKKDDNEKEEYSKEEIKKFKYYYDKVKILSEEELENIEKIKGIAEDDFLELQRIKKRRESRKNQKVEQDETYQKASNRAENIFNPVIKNITELENNILQITELSDKNEIKKVIDSSVDFIKNYLNETIEFANNQFTNVEKERIISETKYNSITAIQEFSAELAHIILTAVNRVSRYSQFIKNEFPNPDLNTIFKSYAFDIHEQMTSLEKVVTFMLDVNKKENYEELDLKTLIEGLFEYDYSDILETNNVFPMIEIIDNHTIFYNRKAIEDVFENLITNSIKAMRFSEGSKKLKCKAIIENENYIITFSDNGCGIEPDFEKRIFDIYYTTTQEIGGSGVGLFIVKTRLEAIGGNIELIENEFKPSGATFKITIPLINK